MALPLPAAAQSAPSSADVWSAAATFCTAQWEICTEIAERGAAPLAPLDRWSGSGAERAIPGEDDVPALLSETSYQTRVRPTEVTANHLAALRALALKNANALEEVAGTHAEAMETIRQRLERLARSVARNQSLVDGANRPVAIPANPAMASIGTMPGRTILPEPVAELAEQLAESFDQARAVSAESSPDAPEQDGRPSRARRNKASRLNVLRRRMAFDVARFQTLVEETDWPSRYISVDEELLLGLQQMVSVFEILYAEDLALYATERRDFPRAQHLTILTQMAQALRRLREQATWIGLATSLREAHAAHAAAVDTVLVRHRAGRFRGQLTAGGGPRTRTPKICLLDQDTGFAAVLDASMTARPLNGVYEIDFDPKASEAALQNDAPGRACVRAGTVTGLSDVSPTGLIDGVLGMNAFLTLQVEQLNWAATHIGLVEDFERSAIELAGRLQQLAGAVEGEAMAIAHRGVEIGCGMNTVIDSADGGQVLFDASVARNGDVSEIRYLGALPNGVNERRFTRELKRGLQCEPYAPHSIDGDRIETLKTIQLEIEQQQDGPDRR
ncbi:MAG: hypothetical protein ACFB6R_07765 [Alphaproteobacteria bacterium]